MLQRYYYAIGTIFRTLDPDGIIIEDCAFLNKEGNFIDTGLGNAVVYSKESQALTLAHEANGRVIRVHHEYVEQMDIDIEN